MEKLTSAASKTLRDQTLQDLRRFISSPASEDGLTPYASPGGLMIDRRGPEAAPANPSAPPVSGEASTTSAISGPRCGGSSPSARLQSSLESRLRQRMAAYGSPEYALTWKHWDMLSGPPICALRASGRRTSGNDFTGWPTPDTGMNIVDSNWQERRKIAAKKHGNNGFGMTLGMASSLAGWPTPNAIPETRGGLQTNPEKALERRQKGHALNLDDAVCLAGWPTPMAGAKGTETYNEAGNTDSSRKTVALVSGWATPTTRDYKDGASTLENVPINGLLGRQVSLSPAQTEKRGALNPQFSLWLMGFPIAWAHCAALVTRSSRRLPQSSSKPT